MQLSLHEWNALCAYSAQAFDPVRSEPLPEQLNAGDVLDDGSILMPDGSHLMHGRVWLREGQAHQATFYGWVAIAGISNGQNLVTGELVMLMGRWPA